MKIGTNIQLETATTDTKDEKLYLADSTENAVVIIDAKTQQFEKIMNVGLYPWGTHIMVIFIRAALDHRNPGQSYIDAVIDGSATRLRPKLMTVAAIVLSLLPVMLSNGAGMEIMKPIAAPSIGGMVTSSLHVLFMTP